MGVQGGNMSSAVDATVPADNVKVDKSKLRANFSATKSEIEELQRTTRLPWQIAFGTVST